jgi:tetratricopeptide (TPR) repeat protein
MKSLFFFLLLWTTTPEIFGQNSDDENLKKAVQAETMALFNHDAIAWQNSWLHSPDISITYISTYKMRSASGWDYMGPNTLKHLINIPGMEYCEARTLKGWENMGQNVIRYLKELPKENLKNFQTDSFAIISNGSNAWVSYKQTITLQGEAGMETRATTESRILVKSNNQWKIKSEISFYMPDFQFGEERMDTSVASSTETTDTLKSITPEDIEKNLNKSGYDLLASNKIKDAIEVFKLNVRLFPKSWNVYDSLGEGYAADGNKKLAIENYTMSVKLNPQNKDGIKAIEKLGGQYFAPH